MPILQDEDIDPLDLSSSSKGAKYWKTPAKDLTEAACKGWLEKEGHVVKNWRRRWFVLWPASGSKWAQFHSDSLWAQTRGTQRTQQLLLYYESSDSPMPKGIVPLEPGRFTVQSEDGGLYRGEETLVLSVQAETAAHSRYIIRSVERGNPGDLPREHRSSATHLPLSCCRPFLQAPHTFFRQAGQISSVREQGTRWSRNHSRRRNFRSRSTIVWTVHNAKRPRA